MSAGERGREVRDETRGNAAIVAGSAEPAGSAATARDAASMGTAGGAAGSRAFPRAGGGAGAGQASSSLPTVSVILVLWNCESFLGRCLASLRAQTLPGLEVVAVDNASADGSAALFAAELPQGRLIRSAANLGFAGGANLGIRSTAGELVLLLNPDVVLRPEFVERLAVALLAAGGRTGWAAGKLLRSSAGRPTGILDSTGHFLTRARYPSNRGWGEADRGQYDERREPFGACAAAALYRREMLEEVRLGEEYFDADFRSYFEDADLDWRAALAGWRCLYVPEAVAWHERGGSGGERLPRVQRDMVRNHILMIVKNDQPLLLLRDFPYLVLYWLKVLALMVASPGLARGLLGALRLLPSAVRKRRVVQSRRTVSRRRMEGWFSDLPLREKLRLIAARAAGRG